MRTIKFRGKIVKDSTFTHHDDWTYGDLSTVDERPKIDNGMYYSEVKEETVGQFTGLLDKNGKEIFEGDIVKMSTVLYGDEIFRICYEDSHIGAFCLCPNEQKDTSQFGSIFGKDYGYEPFYCEVIGNIYDNKELLKVK